MRIVRRGLDMMRLLVVSSGVYLFSDPSMEDWGFDDDVVVAPHIHANALETLKEYIKPGSNVLDIGSGSGYLCAVMGHMVVCFPLDTSLDDTYLYFVSSLFPILRRQMARLLASITFPKSPIYRCITSAKTLSRRRCWTQDSSPSSLGTGAWVIPPVDHTMQST